MHGPGVLAVPADTSCSELLGKQHRAVSPPPELPSGLQRDPDVLESQRRWQAPEEPGRIRRHNQPCTHLAQPGGLLVDRHSEARPVQECGRGKSADTSANDGDAAALHRARDAPESPARGPASDTNRTPAIRTVGLSCSAVSLTSVMASPRPEAGTNLRSCPACVSSMTAVSPCCVTASPRTSAQRAAARAGSMTSMLRPITPPGRCAGAPPVHSGPAQRQDSGGSAQSSDTMAPGTSLGCR